MYAKTMNPTDNRQRFQLVQLISSAVLLLGAVACGGSSTGADAPPPPPPTDDMGDDDPAPAGPEPLDTGKDCATAEATCDGGLCTAKVKNDCDTAITCELAMYSLCRGSTTGGEARGKGRNTIPSKSEGEIEGVANCEGAVVDATIADGLSCK